MAFPHSATLCILVVVATALAAPPQAPLILSAQLQGNTVLAQYIGDPTASFNFIAVYGSNLQFIFSQWVVASPQNPGQTTSSLFALPDTANAATMYFDVYSFNNDGGVWGIPITVRAVLPSPLPSASSSPAPPAASASASPTPSSLPSSSPSPSPLASPSASAAAPQPNNMDCTLLVPNAPLSVKGLSTPYELVATDSAQGPCSQAGDQATFVEATIVDLDTGALFVYHPLVIDKGSSPAVAPVVPVLPKNHTVGIWFGTNADTLTLQNFPNQNGLQDGNCVNGVEGSIFGQFAYCNAKQFFQSANDLIARGKLKVPPLGFTKGGLPCHTTRDFSVVDMDQSDNVLTEYIVTQSGAIAQNNAANRQKFGRDTQVNGSDNRLLAVALDTVLECTPFTAPSLDDQGAMSPSLALNELQAAAHQRSPIALVPAGDPMVLVDGKKDLRKLNLYREGVNMARVASLRDASTADYCRNYRQIAPAIIGLEKQFTVTAASPDTDVGVNLFAFLAHRFSNSWGQDGLNCGSLLGMSNPITLIPADGPTTSAIITLTVV